MPQNRAIFFSHFDPDGRIDTYVFDYLTSLQKLGDIYFVSTSKTLANDDILRAEKICKFVSLRENEGYDFSSWKLSWDQFNVNHYQYLYLVNDSVFGPFWPYEFEKLVIQLEQQDNDIYGLTTNSEISIHIQSYFLGFRLNNKIRQFLIHFFSHISTDLSKQKIIENYEIGLSTQAMKLGYKLGAFADINQIIKENQLPLDTISLPIFHWDLLINKYRFPFIKRDLFTSIRPVDNNLLYSVLDNNNIDTQSIKQYFLRTNQFWR